MKIDKKRIFKKILAIIIGAIFFFGLYVAYIAFLAVLNKADEGGPLLAIYVVFPIFIISGILTVSCGKWCGFSPTTRSLPLTGMILPFIILALRGSIFGFLILLNVGFFALCLFIGDLLEIREKIKKIYRKYCYVILALILIILNAAGVYYFKNNLTWGDSFLWLHAKEQNQVITEIFTAKNFNTQKAAYALSHFFWVCDPKPTAEGEAFVKHLISASGNDLLKLSILKLNLKNDCYPEDVIDFAKANWKDAEPAIKNFYQQNKINDMVTIQFMLEQYTKTAQISRSEKLLFFWSVITEYRYKNNNSSYQEKYLFSILLQHFFELLQPSEYQANIKQYLASNKSPVLRAIMLYFASRASLQLGDLQHIPSYKSVMKEYESHQKHPPRFSGDHYY